MRSLPEASSNASWREHPDQVRPTVLVLGGFLTAPPLYRRFEARLRSRGAAGVVVSNVWTPDWVLATARGLAAVATRGGRAAQDALALSGRVSSGAPLLVVGHSAGGLIARLLTIPEPYPGRRFDASPTMAAIVTLGSPHTVSRDGRIGGRIQALSVTIADAVPGAFFAPATGYVSVGSRAIAGRPDGSGRERVAYQLYRAIVGPAAGVSVGDGLVPLQASQLNGAAHVALDGIVHGPGSGGPWYGTDAALDVWWPVALAAWQKALSWRAAEQASAGRLLLPHQAGSGPASPQEPMRRAG